MNRDLIAIAEQFVTTGKVVSIQQLGQGNINQTYLVTVEASDNVHFVLQQLNTQVFTRPELVMDNMQLFIQHINQKLASLPLNSDRKTFGLCQNRRWQVPQILLNSQARHHYLDSNKGFWRAITFIENTLSFNEITNLENAREIGYSLGLFHTLISDLDVSQLADTLPGFHITPDYLLQYDRTVAVKKHKNSPEANYCHNFIAARRNFVGVLEQAKAANILPLRPIHGDPKVNNILFDSQKNIAISIIDLDTIKPGLIHYDIGDCLRSGCNVLGEETPNWQQVTFNSDIAEAILNGYLSVAKSFITQAELDYICTGIRLIAFELGLRFFTDYLNNNVYFKVTHPEHNLQRALVQFQLTKSIESQEKNIEDLVTMFAIHS